MAHARANTEEKRVCARRAGPALPECPLLRRLRLAGLRRSPGFAAVAILALALGAGRAPASSSEVIREGMLTALVGIVLGSGGAYGVGRAMQGMWYDVGAMDPAAFSVVAITIVGVGAASRASSPPTAPPRSIRWRSCS